MQSKKVRRAALLLTLCAAAMTLIGASSEWSEASIAGAPERTQATLYSAFTLNEHLQLATYVVAGLSDASPDAGSGIRLTLR